MCTSCARRQSPGRLCQGTERMTTTNHADIDNIHCLHLALLWIGAMDCCCQWKGIDDVEMHQKVEVVGSQKVQWRKGVKNKWKNHWSYWYCVQRINECFVDAFDQMPWTTVIKLNYLKFWSPLTIVFNFLNLDLIHQTLEIIDGSAK